MQILKNAGSFEILTPEDVLRDQLLMIERAGRTCYQSERGEITLDTASKFVRMILRRGHESVIEHSSMVVQFSDLSRGFTHEQVRHRLTAVSQESTRYVDYAKEGDGPDLDKFEFKCVIPPHRDENEKINLEDGRTISPTEMFANYETYYRALRKAGWPPEDARQFLPIGIKSQIVTSANFREWRHIFTMRTGKPAHWEIRQIIVGLLKKVQSIVPAVFDDFQEDGVDRNEIPYFKKCPIE